MGSAFVFSYLTAMHHMSAKLYEEEHGTNICICDEAFGRVKSLVYQCKSLKKGDCLISAVYGQHHNIEVQMPKLEVMAMQYFKYICHLHINMQRVIFSC